jgi:hypothetical protein
MRRVPSVEKLVSLTGFRPQIKLEEIIDRVSGYLAEKKAASRPREVSRIHA